MIYKMTLKDSVDTMTFNLLETPIVDKDIEGAVDNVTLDGNQYTDYLYLKKQYIQKWAIMCPDGYDELRGFYTRQFEDGEVPSYRVYYGANVTRDYTLNGDYFQFNAEGIETGMTLSQLLGNAEQTTYSGKNLFNKDGATFFTSSSTTVSPLATGVRVSYSGTSTTNARYVGFLLGDVSQYVGKNIVISARISASASNAPRLSLGFCDSSAGNRQTIDWLEQTGSIYHTITSSDLTGHSYIYIYAYANYTTGTIASGDYIDYADLQVEISTSTAPSDYEPYVGGIPAPNPQFPMLISTVTGAQTVVVTGKNLLDTSDPHDKSGSGMTATWNNGVVEVKGTNTATSFPLSDNIALPTQIKAGTEISASFGGASVGNTVFRFFNQATSQYESLSVTTPNTSGTYTLTRDADAVQLYKGGVPTNTYKEFSISNWQIEYGSTATTYTPYQGQSSYEVNLGKNLWGGFPSSFTTNSGGLNGYTNNADGTISIPAGTTTATSYSCDRSTAQQNGFYIKLQTGTYTVSGATSTIGLQCIDMDANVNLGTSFTITEPKNVMIRTRIDSGKTVSAMTIRPQLEAGSTATTYASYFTPIELAKVGDYQDRIYKDDGKWYIEKNVGKLVFNSTNASSIMQNPSNPNRYLNPSGSTIFTGLALSLPSFQSYCSHYTFVRNGSAWQGIGKCGFDPTGTFWLMDSTTNLSTLQTWLASEEVYIYYPLATPTTTEITDDTLLYQLNFLASLYGGVNNISLVGTGAQGEMEVFIRDVMSVETDVVPEVPVRLTLTDDGVINACGCRRNVQLTMRETTE